MFAAVRSWLARFRFAATQPNAKRIIVVAILTWALTIVGLYFGVQYSDNKTAAALFQSWTGDVIFFSIVTVLISVISTIPPARESFEQRAAILFQGLKGSQVDFARSLLNRLGNYSEKTHTTVTIHRVEEGWFRLLVKTTHNLRNLIEDVRTTYVLPLVDTELFVDKPPGREGEVLSFSVDGKIQSALPKVPGHEAAYSVDIGGENIRVVEFLLSRWIGAGGHTANSFDRFTKQFTLELVNNLDEEIFVKLEQPKMGLVSLAGGTRRDELVTLSNLEPRTLAFEFYLFRSRIEYKKWKAERTRVG